MSSARSAEKTGTAEKIGAAEKNGIAEEIGATETIGVTETIGTAEKIGIAEEAGIAEETGTTEEVGTTEETEISTGCHRWFIVGGAVVLGTRSDESSHRSQRTIWATETGDGAEGTLTDFERRDGPEWRVLGVLRQ